MPAIAELRLRAVRGIRADLRIPLGGKSLVVRGGNGTGKSSIVRGLQWALRGESAPTGVSSPGGAEAFRAHVLEDPSAPRVSVTFVDGTTLVVKPRSVTGDAAPLAYREACLRSNPFLDRSRLLSFLQDKPSDRFRYIDSFLDLGQADEVRDLMAREAERARASADRHASTRIRLVERVVAQLPDGHRPVESTWSSTFDALVTLARSLSVLDASSGDSWEELLVAAAKARSFVEGDKLPLQRTRLRVAQQQLQAVTRRCGDAFPDTRALRSERDRFALAATDAEALKVLENAAAYVAGAASTSCPVCRQGVDRDALLAELRERLDALTAFRAASVKLDAAHAGWRERVASFVAALKNGAKALGTKSFRDRADAPVAPRRVAELARASSDEAFAAILREVDEASVISWMRSLAALALADVESALAALPPEGSTGCLKALADATTEGHRNKDGIATALEGELLARREADTFGKVAEAIRHARQDLAKDLVEQISVSIGEFYRAIHPRADASEITDAPAIEIQRSGAGTAYVRGTFHGQRVEDPRWVYSEGHLDTVGICVFLAMRRLRAQRPNDPRLMVLDDVILSIDLGHAGRVLDVLREHFADHQILLFTHNGLFFDWCQSRLHFPRRVIHSWSLDHGPRLGDHVTWMERLEEAIASSTSPKGVAMAMMALLDEWLGEARMVFALSVPARRGEQYTLSEMWNPFVKALGAMEKTLGTPIGNAQALTAKMRDAPRVRNSLAAHANDFALEYPLDIIQELGRAAIELVRTLYCTCCGGFAEPMPNREEPFSIHCRCETLRYTRPAPASPRLPA